MRHETNKIERLLGIDASAIPSHVFESTQPLVLQGLVADWPIVQAGNRSATEASEYIQGFDSAMPLTVYQGEPEINGRIFYNDALTGFNFERTRQTLAKVIESIFAVQNSSQPPTYYVGSTMIDHWLPGFRSENDINLDGRDSLVSLWLGNRSKIAAHYDFPNNIACVVTGRRRFTLFPPEQIDNLYVGPLDFTPSGQAISLVDSSNPDLTRFPKYAKALESAQVVELMPGDALYIPSMWWHHVEALDTFNVLVNYWWRTTPVYQGTPMSALLSAILSLRELPQTQKAIWKNLFEHYVFAKDDDDFKHIPEHARGIVGELDEEQANALKAQLRKLLQ